MLLPSWRTEAGFAAAVLALCGIWLAGLTLRARLWDVDIEVVRRAGISRVFRNGSGSATEIFLVISAATLAYLGCLWALRKGFRHSLAAAIVATTMACLAFMPSVALTSPDAVHLAADVRTFWLHGKLPTARENAPAKIDDPVAKEVRVFANSPSGYGPVAYAIGGIPIPFVGDGLRANLFGQKVVAGVFLVITAALAGLVARRIGGNPGLTAGLIGLNPLMLWQFPGDGHNDVVMAAFGVGALLFITNPRWKDRGIGTGLAIVSVLSKFGLLLASPLVGAYWFPRWRKHFAAFVLLVGMGVFLMWALRLWPGIGTVGPAGAIARTTPWGLLVQATDPGGDVSRRLVGLAYALFFALLAYIVMFHRLETPRDVATAFATAMFLFLFVCMPGYLPWYQVWYLPFAMISGRRWLIVASMMFSVGAFLPILALNFSGAIEREMGISNPVEKAVVTLYLAVAVAAIILQRSDVNREAQRAEQRPAMRRAKRGARRV